MACKDIVSMATLLQSQDWEGHAVSKCVLFAVVPMSVNTKNKRNERLAFCFPCKDVLDWPYEIGTSKKSQKTLHSCSVSKSQCVSLSRPLPWWVLHGWGYVHIRIRLRPVVVPGDCLASVYFYAFLIDCSHVSDVQWFGVVLVRRFLRSWFMYMPLRAVSLDHMYIHSHGSLYPMMDYTLRVLPRIPRPMSADVPWGSLWFFYH